MAQYFNTIEIIMPQFAIKMQNCWNSNWVTVEPNGRLFANTPNNAEPFVFSYQIHSRAYSIFSTTAKKYLTVSKEYVMATDATAQSFFYVGGLGIPDTPPNIVTCGLVGALSGWAISDNEILQPDKGGAETTLNLYIAGLY